MVVYVGGLNKVGGWSMWGWRIVYMGSVNWVGVYVGGLQWAWWTTRDGGGLCGGGLCVNIVGCSQ